jgi:hypothetical protein
LTVNAFLLVRMPGGGSDAVIRHPPRDAATANGGSVTPGETALN